MAEPDAGAHLGPIVEQMGPPLARVPWSPDFAVQAVEILPVGIRDGRLFWLKPVHAGSLQVGLPKAANPSEFILEVIGWYPLRPLVVHSTSWRLVGGRVILTYLVAIEPPVSLPRDSLVEVPVARVDLARGGSMSAPKSIAEASVLEHALRHLAWLLRDDEVIGEALAGWLDAVAGYQPEPFRALT